MQKIVIAASFLLLVTGALQAQTPTRDTTAHHTNMKHGRNGMARLNLTDAQKRQAKEMRDSYRKREQELRGNTQLSEAELDNQLKALHQEQRKKMQGILTPDQKAQMASAGKHSMKKRPSSANMDKMKNRLGLTDEQAAKIQENRADFQSKMKAIRADQNLTAEQKKEQLQSISKEQHEKMQSILTPEQKAKMKTLPKKKEGSTRK